MMVMAIVMVLSMTLTTCYAATYTYNYDEFETSGELEKLYYVMRFQLKGDRYKYDLTELNSASGTKEVIIGVYDKVTGRPVESVSFVYTNNEVYVYERIYLGFDVILDVDITNWW